MITWLCILSGAMSSHTEIKNFIQHIQGLKPPYECPVNDCGKVYKTFSGIQYHLYHYDHDNPESLTPNRKPKKNHWRKNTGKNVSPVPEVKKVGRDPLTYAESQRLVEVDLDGNVHRINIHEPLQIISQHEIDNCSNTEKEEQLEKSSSENCKQAKKDGVATAPPAPPVLKLPEASFKVLDEYEKLGNKADRPNSYFRFIEKSVEELDEEVEYDMDEEDYAWLELINEERRGDNNLQVSQSTFEMIMDRFEKEAFFQSKSSGKDSGPPIDEDAVCAICMDGECQNSNVILFCDMCNLAVHQECYGVPYIPEGQWLCRRCLQSPSRAVDCCLCPNKGGAFKQTDDGRWSHVVCALWIPEVRFSNTVFLEPIDSIEQIPAARWKLTCYICKQRGNGACIQCHKTNCYTAFHVTCSQQAGLYMKIEPVRETTISGTTVSVRKTAFCDLHTPPDMDYHPMIDNGVSSDEENLKTMTPEETKAKSRLKMRRARKILAEKRNAVPVVSIPTISPQKLNKIATRVQLGRKVKFLAQLQSYWNLKRQSRNGVPLLRRLQSSHMSRNKEYTKDDQESKQLREQLQYWQRLRQDLERARLLVELIRKREKLKREQLRLHQMALEMQLTPFVFLLRHILDSLEEKDVTSLFLEPVDIEEVPDYTEVIKHPMDLQTMRKKAEGHHYTSINQFQDDFNLMIDNCLLYNHKSTPYYQEACKMKEQGTAVINSARKITDLVGYDPETGFHKSEVSSEAMNSLDDSFLSEEQRKNIPLATQLEMLLDRLEVANNKRTGKRSGLTSQLKKEIQKVRQQLISHEKEAAKDSEAVTASENESGKVETTDHESVKEEMPEQESEQKVERGKLRRESSLSSVVESDNASKVPPKPVRNMNVTDTETDGNLSDLPDTSSKKSEPQKSPKRGNRKGRKRSIKGFSREKTSDKTTNLDGPGGKVRKRYPGPDVTSEDDSEPVTKRSAQDLSMPQLTRAESVEPPLHKTKESFQQYRQLNANFESEQDSTSDSCSTDDSMSESELGDSSDSDGSAMEKTDVTSSGATEDPLEPLDLVWAKCRGYPWYPALIINPKMPKTGYFHNGVPIPVPPDEVLALQKKYEGLVYLVLFFDTKRTWQWLVRSKLEPLGADHALDKSKLHENKKPNVRKAVRKAYEKAISHRCRVMGKDNPLPLTSDSECPPPDTP